MRDKDKRKGNGPFPELTSNHPQRPLDLQVDTSKQFIPSVPKKPVCTFTGFPTSKDGHCTTKKAQTNRSRYHREGIDDTVWLRAVDHRFSFRFRFVRFKRDSPFTSWAYVTPFIDKGDVNEHVRGVTRCK